MSAEAVLTLVTVLDEQHLGFVGFGEYLSLFDIGITFSSRVLCSLDCVRSSATCIDKSC